MWGPRTIFSGIAYHFFPALFLPLNISSNSSSYSFCSSSSSAGTVGWFWGAGKEFVQRFEGAAVSYIRDTEPAKHEFVRSKVDTIIEKSSEKDVARARLVRTAWIEEHKVRFYLFELGFFFFFFVLSSTSLTRSSSVMPWATRGSRCVAPPGKTPTRTSSRETSTSTTSGSDLRCGGLTCGTFVPTNPSSPILRDPSTLRCSS